MADASVQSEEFVVEFIDELGFIAATDKEKRIIWVHEALKDSGPVLEEVLQHERGHLSEGVDDVKHDFAAYLASPFQIRASSAVLKARGPMYFLAWFGGSLKWGLPYFWFRDGVMENNSWKPYWAVLLVAAGLSLLVSGVAALPFALIPVVGFVAAMAGSKRRKRLK